MHNEKDYNLDTTCFKPLGDEYGCVIYSLTGFWQYNINKFNNRDVLGDWFVHFTVR